MLQRGMNFRIKPEYSIILMSVRKNAPYKDRWHENTGTLEYEGHDEPRRGNTDPKLIDQPYQTKNGALTQNGKFFEAAQKFKAGKRKPEPVHVYEKISQGIWCDQGRFELIDAKQVKEGERKVFKFFLQAVSGTKRIEPFLKQTRMIPTSVKVEVWKRDQGQCVICQATENLHFDHDIPYSKGGSSITADNVRILCAKHNLSKSDRIMGLLPYLMAASTIISNKA